MRLYKDLFKRTVTVKNARNAFLFYLLYKAGSGVFSISQEYHLKHEGIRKIRKKFLSPGEKILGMPLMDFLMLEFRHPLAYIVPNKPSNLQSLFKICRKYGLSVGFSDKHEYDELFEGLEEPVKKPFVIVNLRKLNEIKIVEEDLDSKPCKVIQAGIGATAESLLEACDKAGLSRPFIPDEDLKKSLWRITKENSLALGSLQKYISKTEAYDANGDLLTSSSPEPDYGKQYDFIETLLAENGYIGAIHSLNFKFPEAADSLVNKIEFRADRESNKMTDFFNLLQEFREAWPLSIQTNVSMLNSDGRFVNYLKVSSKYSEKVYI